MTVATALPVVVKLRTAAATMQKEIDKLMRRNEGLPPTRKRQNEREQALIDARNLDQKWGRVLAVVAALEAERLPPSLCEKAHRLKRSGIVALLDTDSYPDASSSWQAERLASLQGIGIYERNFAQAKADLLALPGPDGSLDERAIALRRAEEAIRPGSITGFWPTPNDVADRLLDNIELTDGQAILEPSAGNGALADRIRLRIEATELGGTEIHVCEIAGQLREVLELKGYTIAPRIGLDFMKVFPTDQDWRYDVIVGNPPFEAGQDIDHIMRAYDWLTPRGQLAMICSTGPFFRNDRKSHHFRAWLAEVGGEREDQPEGAFKSIGTGVNVCFVTIRKWV